MSVAFRALMNEVRWRGTWGTIRAIKMNKMGTMQYFVAEDEQGNKYFENPHETYGRDRWVEYSDFKNFDSSNVSPQWHAWLHKMVDDVDAVPPAPVYGRPVTRNLSGTPQAYVPTAHRNSGKSEGAQKPKYEAWEPQGESKGKPTAGMKDVLDLK